MSECNVTLPSRVTPADIFEDLFPTEPRTGYYFAPLNDSSPSDGKDDDVYFKIFPDPRPIIDQLASYDEVELTQMARVIALTHRQYLVGASVAEKEQHVRSTHAFGIQLCISKNSTLNGLVQRLGDARWWRRRINKVADERREHLAQINRQLGRRASEKCCSKETLAIMKARKAKTEKFLGGAYKVLSETVDRANPVVFSLLEVSKAQQANRINELYLDVKAMEKISEDRGWGWMFITLTAPPEYHSNPAYGRNSYDSCLSPRDANKAIGKDWIAICGALKEQGMKPSQSYFGFRVTEVHEDGCPHWHVLIFHMDGVREVVEKAISRIYQDRPGSYFERNKESIIRIGRSKDDKSAASAASYIYGYLAYALAGGGRVSDASDTAYKYQCAVRAMGARQYQMFGVKGARGKLRALAKVKRQKNTPKHISDLAGRLYVDQAVEGRNEIQLAARVDFFLGAASKIEFIKKSTLNHFGEPVERVVGLKHQDDSRHVTVSGFCQDADPAIVRRMLVGCEEKC